MLTKILSVAQLWLIISVLKIVLLHISVIKHVVYCISVMLRF